MNRTMLKSAAIAFSLGAFGATAPVLAHHSGGMFDVTKTITLTGTVKTFQWTNPHIHLWVMVNPEKAGGEPVLWVFEKGSPGTERRSGWTNTTFKTGDKIILTMHPVRDGRHAGQLDTVSMNGKLVGRARNKSDTEKPNVVPY